MSLTIFCQSFSNPHVRNKLHVYPEDVGTKLSEVRQGSRWLHEMDPELLTPMHRIDDKDYYIFEICRLKDGSFCMPFRWYQCNQKMWCRAWSASIFRPGHEGGWVINKHQVLNLCESDLQMNFMDLHHGAFFGSEYPSFYKILGMLVVLSYTSLLFFKL